MGKGWLIGGGAFLGVLVVASIVVAILEGEESFAEGTPEAAVQSFLRAVEADDFELAYGLLLEELREDCTVEEFAAGNINVGERMKDSRVTLEGTTTVKDTVFVSVLVSRFRTNEPFGTSESSFKQRFSLRQDADQWRFTEYPWPFSQCGLFKPFPVVPDRPSRTPAEPAPEPASRP